MQMQHFHFSRFHPRDKRRTSVSFIKCGGVHKSACLCVYAQVCRFVCQVSNERRQEGDWRWGCINRLDSVLSSPSCISIVILAAFPSALVCKWFWPSFIRPELYEHEETRLKISAMVDKKDMKHYISLRLLPEFDYYPRSFVCVMQGFNFGLLFWRHFSRDLYILFYIKKGIKKGTKQQHQPVKFMFYLLLSHVFTFYNPIWICLFKYLWTKSQATMIDPWQLIPCIAFCLC